MEGQGLTLEQLKGMGATPVGQNGTGGLTLDQLKAQQPLGQSGQATSATSNFLAHPINTTMNALKSAGQGIYNDLQGNNQPTSFIGNVYHDTVGAIPRVLGAPGALVKAAVGGQASNDTYDAASKLFDTAKQNLQMAKNATDPTHQAQYIQMAKQNQLQAQLLMSQGDQTMQSTQFTPSQALGQTINAAGMVALGMEGMGGGVVNKFAPQAINTLNKVPLVGKILPTAVRAGENYGIGVGLNAGHNLQNNEGAMKNANEAGLLSAAIPLGFEGVGSIKSGLSSQFGKLGQGAINRIIGSRVKDYKYGANPAQGILDEVKNASSFDNLKSQVNQKTDIIGQQIGRIGEQIQKVSKSPLDLSPALAPIDNAMQTAAKTNNQTLLKRLSDVKVALTNELSQGTKNIDGEELPTIIKGAVKNLTNTDYKGAVTFVKDLKDITGVKYTGNPSDDKLVNETMQRVMQSTRQIMNKHAIQADPKLGQQIMNLNGRYHNIISASDAINRTAKNLEGSSYVKFMKQLGYSAGVALPVATAVLTGDFKKAGAVLVAELGTALGAKAIGSTPVQLKVGQFLNALGPSERQGILSSTPVLKEYYNRLTGNTEPQKEIPQNVPKSVLQTVADQTGTTPEKIQELLPFLELGKKSATKAGLSTEYEALVNALNPKKEAGDSLRGMITPQTAIGGAVGATGVGLGAANLMQEPTTAQSTPQAPVEDIKPKTQSIELPDRKASITPEDIKAALPIIYGEVSNRPPEKKLLEARVILNTAINRIQEYAKHGQILTLKQVLEMPNQYQAFQGKQYNEYTNQNSDATSTQKKKEVNSVVNQLLQEMKAGTFKDNTEGAFYYAHKGDKIYYDNKKPLFK